MRYNKTRLHNALERIRYDSLPMDAVEYSIIEDEIRKIENRDERHKKELKKLRKVVKDYEQKISNL